ncbi:carboxypeptidase regulatory-like domain-containing protein [Corallococcus sp. AB045]|uniref:carboxypeptidase-like regulatory domain-containing protein n=1 Tax=Corallococcus sp. AB045 TaxID=2316719 RepID=UPI000EC14274|nr:carboxypeptidase-like regulatory domain-containing protein [Corallococcus sp. AB045]RKH84086.1 carboxypeptidase regulatory-like domain-containing protein [Corallococcus sp. AB045]
MRRGHRVAGFTVVVVAGLLLLAFFLRGHSGAPARESRGATHPSGGFFAGFRAGPSSTPSTGSARITGVVRDARGPVAGARVSASRVDADSLSQRACPSEPPSRERSCAGKTWLTKCCFHERGFELARLVEAREGDAPVFAQTVTADDGTFILDGLPAGVFTLWALGDTGAAMKPEVSAGSTDVALTLEAGIFLSGTVMDEDTRAPIPGARVTAVQDAQSRFFDTLTNAQGRFRIGPIPPGRYLQVGSAQGWRTTAFREGVWFDTDVDVTLALQKQARIEGLVLTPEGRPASGITVQAYFTGVSDDAWSTRSDAQGRFVFEDVVGAPYTVWVWAWNETAIGDAPAKAPAQVVIRMEPVTFMEGTVRDERGRPLEGVLLQGRNLPLEAAPSPDAMSDAAGHYKLGPLRQTTMNLQLRHARYSDRTEEIDLRTPHAGPWDFTLQQTVSVEGWVVDTEGTPLPGIRLRLAKGPVGTRERAFIEETAALSDDAGHFILDTPKEGAGHLFIDSEGFSSMEQPVEVPSTGVRVVLSRGASVSGKVVDAKGAPLPHAEVLLWDPTALGGDKDPRSLQVDSEGTFSAAGLKAGHHVLEARLPTPGIERSVTEAIDLDAHSQVTVSLRFEEGRTVKGLTVDTDGQPLAGVRVQACLSLEDAPEWRTRSLRCDADDEPGVLSGPGGHFVLEHLVDPAHQIVAWKEGHAFVPSRSRGGTPGPAALVVRTGAEDVQLVLQERPRLRGQVVNEDGMPVSSQVWVGGRREPAPDGALALPLLRDGPEQLTVRAKGFFALERDFVVSPGKDIDLGTLVLRRSRKIRFILLDAATLAPLVGARAFIGRRECDDRSCTGPYPSSFYGNLDAEGGADVEGLPFTPIAMSVRLRPDEPTTDVLLDARQETITVLVPAPNR